MSQLKKDFLEDNIETKIEEIIREPDKSYNEKLIEQEINEELNQKTKENCSAEDEIEIALNLSIKEYLEINEENDKYEKSCINDYENEIKYREKKFEKLLKDLQRLSIFDKSIKKLYEILEPIILNYIYNLDQNIINTLDNENINYIIKNLKTIRIDKDILDLLLNILENSISD